MKILKRISRLFSSIEGFSTAKNEAKLFENRIEVDGSQFDDDL